MPDLPFTYILAPIAGVSDAPFRLLCREMGADLTFTEMISSDGLVHNFRKTSQYLQQLPEESSVGIQLFGSKPEIIREAVHILNDYDCPVLDFNAGCPVKKVFGSGSGSALLADLNKLRQIMEIIVRDSRHPVSLKIRKGITDQDDITPEVIRMAEELNLYFLTIHGRSRKQMFSGLSDWSVITRAVKTSRIPIVGNGDIIHAQDAFRRMEESGCTAVMIARGAMGNPFIFRQIKQPDCPMPSWADKLKFGLRQMELGLKIKNEHTTVVEMRKHWLWYCKGEPHSAHFKQHIVQFMTCQDVSNYVTDFIAELDARYFPFSPELPDSVNQEGVTE